ncbi:uncharacterized protein LOC141984551 [Natator depressus]|uniref:uncharacterized protein LOC141984551 n=1 Tax=Natator depressus TaxID=27790 RepID=UPI003EB81A81
MGKCIQENSDYEKDLGAIVEKPLNTSCQCDAVVNRAKAIIKCRSRAMGTPRNSEDEEEEWVDMATEEAALKNIREQLQGREKEFIEELPDNSPLGTVLVNSLIAVGNLSTMTPALEPELEIHLLQAALHVIFTLGTEKDTTQVQGLARAPGCHAGEPAGRVPRHWQAPLLLGGLTIHEAEDLWCWDWHQDSRLLGYKNTARVGEVFGKFFLEVQRSFLWMAVLAIHDPLLHVSQSGLLLTYSLLGEAQQLMGDKQEAVMANVMRQLCIIQRLCQMPEALQGLCL